MSVNWPSRGNGNRRRAKCAVTISMGEPVEAKQQSDLANTSFIEVMEPMELDQGQYENEILFVQKEARQWRQTKNMFQKTVSRQCI